MAPSTSLARLRLAGKLCRLGAWIIAVAGLIAIILYIIVTFYNNPGNPGNQDPNGQLINYMIALLMAIPIFFFFLALFGMGTLLEYVGREPKPQEARDERDDERLQITSLSDVP